MTSGVVDLRGDLPEGGAAGEHAGAARDDAAAAVAGEGAPGEVAVAGEVLGQGAPGRRLRAAFRPRLGARRARRSLAALTRRARLACARPYGRQTQGDVPLPVLVVALAEVVAQLHAARLFAQQRASWRPAWPP